MDYRFRQGSGARLRTVLWQDDDVGPEGAEFGSYAALGIDLQIEERRRNGSAGPERQQNHKKAPAIGPEQMPNDAPKHLPILRARGCHHSPRRIGAGS
jgi:hypothetical protein